MEEGCDSEIALLHAPFLKEKKKGIDAEKEMAMVFLYKIVGILRNNLPKCGGVY